MTTERVMLDPQEEIVVRTRVADPGAALDQLLERATDARLRARIEGVKALPIEEQEQWLLAGARPVDRTHRMEPASGCIIVVIAVTITVVVGYIVVNGIREALTEQREVEREVEQCIDEQNRPNAAAAGTDEVQVGGTAEVGVRNRE